MSEWESKGRAASALRAATVVVALLLCLLSGAQEKSIDIGLPGGGIVILSSEGENDGGLIDIDLPDLPLPILGADAFEPDNTPALAIWNGLENLIDGLLPTKKAHNFHVAGDEDWTKFQARRGSEVTVETLDVRSLADTFITVYRLAENTEPLPTQTPGGCEGPWRDGPDGERLFYIACNDDAGGTGSQAKRSKVVFTAPASGIYYARITLSPKAAAAKGLDPDSGETTYNYQAYSKDAFATTLFCSVLNDANDNPVSGANVRLQPINVQAQESSGVYTVSGVYQGNYTLVASAQGYDNLQMPVAVSSDGAQEVTVHLQPSEEPTGNPGVPAPTFDFAQPHGHVDLQEVLRAVQLFNAHSYHCDNAGEDKYSPFPGSLQCAPHPLDYRVQDWTIDLSELLRILQLFSLGAYTPCENGEAGACV